MIINSLKIIFSLIIVAFGLPAFSSFLSVLSTIFGFALFFSVLIEIPSAKKRFWYATIWFACVQAVQLYWLVSHPYSYIYGLYLFLSLGIGLQMGLIALFITPERMQRWSTIFGIAGLYTLLEWLRLFLFSGYSLNPIGLSMTSTLWGLQNASLVGVYGLTFFVLLINLMVLRFFLYARSIKFGVFLLLACLAPYLFGFVHVALHKPGVEEAKKSSDTMLNVLLVQTAFPVEENLQFSSFREAVLYVEEEWNQILKVIQGYLDHKVDLLVLPEYVVPYGTYMAVFPYADVEKKFEELFGSRGKLALPELKEPLAMEVKGPKGNSWYVTNAYFCQALSELFQSDVVAGLQDDQWISEDEKQSYSSAFYFWPGGEAGFRYEKRVLLPMAEYIPFELCKKYAAKYGISGSFECGTEAKVFPGCKVPFGLSICYEETFGDMMRESRLKGSELLVNVTSDIWYPDSKLPQQHFDHARLRTVESGIPLVRACNTGITSVMDSLGEVIASTTEDEEWVRRGLFAQVPLYSYKTLYSSVGDLLIVLVSAIAVLFMFKPIRK
jgi:apolipoprotein N-acyltransferase